jgi:hypothetical protein
MADIRTRFERLFASLRQAPHIEVLDAEIGPPTNEEDIQFVLQRTKGQLPTGVENFYRAMGWVRLEWRHTVKEIANGNMSDQGFVKILPIKEVFDEWEGIIWWSESEGGNDDDILTDCLPHVVSGTGKWKQRTFDRRCRCSSKITMMTCSTLK